MSNSKWQALSMSERAFLIREAVRNGITDIESIRDTWEHRFDGTRDTIIDGGTIPSVVVTPDSRYTKFVNSLPDNQRNTPESEYYTHLGWELYGKPKDFEEAKQRGMYNFDNSDQRYHGNSVAWDGKTDIGYFLKPKHHETVKYELDWYNKGLETLEGGEQRPLTGKDREFWQDFKSKYKLDESGSDYKYIPRQHRFDGESNNLSREDFYKQKQQEAIQAARLKQQSRTTHLSPIQAKTKEDKELDKDIVKRIQNRIQRRIEAELPSYSDYKRPTFQSFVKKAAQLQKRNSSRIDEDLEYYTERLKSAEEEASKCTKEGFGCIYQALDNYGKVETSNYNFMQFPEKYGFKSIPVEKILPGDLVQFTDDNGYPVHMLMAETPYNNTNENYEGEHMRYSGNAGHELRNNAKFQAPWDSLRAYTFVGDKTDSLRWENNYREEAGHQFSGEKDQSDQGVKYELKKKSIYTPDLNNPFKKFSTAEDAPPVLPKQDLHFEWLRPVDEAMAQGAGFLYDPLFYKKNKILRDKVYNTFYSLDDPDSDINIPEEYEILNREQVRKLLPKRDYVGGKTPKETRDKVASLIPGLIDSLQSISSRHKINPELLHYRISKEGYYDKKASKYNYEIYKDEMPEYWNTVANQEVNGFSELGLDDAGELLEKGLIKVTRPISYETLDGINEKNRNVTSVITPNLWDALEIKAGDIKYRQEEMRKRGISAEDLDTWTNAAYNLGLYHKDLNNEDWIRKNYTLPSYENLFKK